MIDMEWFKPFAMSMLITLIGAGVFVKYLIRYLADRDSMDLGAAVIAAGYTVMTFCPLYFIGTH